MQFPVTCVCHDSTLNKLLTSSTLTTNVGSGYITFKLFDDTPHSLRHLSFQGSPSRPCSRGLAGYTWFTIFWRLVARLTRRHVQSVAPHFMYLHRRRVDPLFLLLESFHCVSHQCSHSRHIRKPRSFKQLGGNW